MKQIFKISLEGTLKNSESILPSSRFSLFRFFFLTDIFSALCFVCMFATWPAQLIPSDSLVLITFSIT